MNTNPNILKPSQALEELEKGPVAIQRAIVNSLVSASDRTDKKRARRKVGKMSEWIRQQVEDAGFYEIGLMKERMFFFMSVVQMMFVDDTGTVRISVQNPPAAARTKGSDYTDYTIWTYFSDGSSIASWSKATLALKEGPTAKSYATTGTFAGDLKRHRELVAQACDAGKTPLIIDSIDDVIDCLTIYYRHGMAKAGANQLIMQFGMVPAIAVVFAIYTLLTT